MKNPASSLVKRLVRLRRKPVVVRRRGAQFLLDPKNWIDNRLLAGAHYENGQITTAQELIKLHQLDLFVDVGANIGLYSILLGQMPEIKDVVAFEPVRRNHAQLMANLFLNGLTNKAEVHRMGLGAESGDVTIHIDPKSTGLSRVDLATAERTKHVFTDQETIHVVQLDSVCHLSGRRAYIKIDVEGHASAVLLGMKTFLENNTVVLQVELESSERGSVVTALAGHGFRLYRQLDGDGIFMRD